MKLRVTLVQQALEWEDAQANRSCFERLLAPLAGQTDLVVLPEMFTTGFSMDAERLAEPAGGPTSQWLTAMARRLDAAVTGSVITRDGGQHFNRLHWAQPDGLLEHYDKRHLFRMAREHEHYTAGREARVLGWRGFRVCPLVCYDLRFPVFSRRAGALDYDLLLYVANWPAVRVDAWSTLLKARAMENQAYVAGVNRIGPDGQGTPHTGQSAALNFLGRPLAELGSSPGVLTAELDLAALREFRERFPAHLDADRFTLQA
ncbi:MAG TPA: amidohydrolase [Steroidobacteraceae bacterium]|nr:amidohydrolase [Steroidobacteraceae bacterium]